MLLRDAKGAVFSAKAGQELTVRKVGLPNLDFVLKNVLDTSPVWPRLHLTAGEMAHIVEVILVDAVVEHLDQVPHKSTMHQATTCGVVTTDKYLI